MHNRVNMVEIYKTRESSIHKDMLHSLRVNDRTLLSAHDYDKNTSSFTRSFIVVGERAD